MPPSRRRPPPSAGQAPPVRRPKVAGLRNRPATEPDSGPDTEQNAEQDTDNAPERESVSGTLDIDDRIDDRPATADATIWPEADATPDPADDTNVRDDRDDNRDEDLDDGFDGFGDDEDQGDKDLDDEPIPARAPSRRPAGKRRATGTTRPADLVEAEAATRTSGARRGRAEDGGRRRSANRLSVAAVLTVVAVVLGGLAFWFKGEADTLESGDSNRALTDSAATSAVLGQLKSAIQETFSYNYTDLEATKKAVDETLTGKARCEYDQLFGQVKELAPKQKIIMVTAVRDIALVRLDGDRAEALVFIDQSSTRVDVNNSVAGEAQFAVQAHRDGDKWKITGFNMFDQPLVNGQPAPKC